MAPKRKAHPPVQSFSTGDVAEQPGEAVSSHGNAATTPSLVLQDEWTDEQETSLFKAVVTWKPVGMHKHFRMIAISQHLRNHGFTSAQDHHTRIPGIWKKLGNLYNLEALNEIEDASTLGYRRDEEYSKEPFYEFELPEDEYSDMLFARRLAPEGPSSPPSVPYQLSREGSLARRRQSTIEDTDEPRSSPASNRGRRGTRASKGTRASLLAESSRSRAGRRTSKVSVDPSTEGDQKEDEGEGEGDAMDVDEDDSKPTTKAPTGGGTRSNARRRGRKR